MDTARYDPDNNPNFRRRWSAPSLKRERPPIGDTIKRAEIEVLSSNQNIDIIFEKFKFLVEVPA